MRSKSHMTAGRKKSLADVEKCSRVLLQMRAEGIGARREMAYGRDARDHPGLHWPEVKSNELASLRPRSHAPVAWS